MKYKIILLALAIPLIVGSNTGYAIATLGGLADEATHASHSSHSNSVAQSESGDGQLDSDCCHVNCVCCTGQGLSTTDRDGSSVNASGAAGTKIRNMPNPHLEGLLRPPRLG